MATKQDTALPQSDAIAGQSPSLVHLHDRLDSLWIFYLRHLDEYTSAQKALQQHMRAGFFSLSRANFTARPGTRYGKDYFHDRAVATSRIKVLENENENVSRPTLEIFQWVDWSNAEKDGGSEEAVQQPSPAATPEPSDTTESIARSDPEPTSNEDEKYSEGERPRTSQLRPPLEADPLRWFGVLVPQELRSARASFSTGVCDVVGQAVNSSRAVREIEADIRKLRKEIRRAEKARKA